MKEICSPLGKFHQPIYENILQISHNVCKYHIKKMNMKKRKNTKSADQEGEQS